MAKRGLGRGLGALIPAGSFEQDTVAGSSSREIAIEAIVPNPYQPRKEMNDSELAELTASIREQGILQPIAVRPHKDKFEIIAGERRFRAAKKAGLKVIPVVVKEATDQQMLVLALIENLQRADLNPLEEATAYQQLADEFGLSQDAVAKQVGKDRSTVANLLRLLKLPDEVQRMVASGVLTAGHARAILSLESMEEQREMGRLVVREHLSVRDLEGLIKQKKPGAGGTRRKIKPRGGKIDSQITSMEEELQRLWGTKVRIKDRGKGGTLEISYYSRDDFERILELLRKGVF